MERPGSGAASLYAHLASTGGGKYDKLESGFLMRNDVCVHTAVFPKHVCINTSFMTHNYPYLIND